MGCDRLISDEVAQSNEFQSTHPSGVRRRGWLCPSARSQISIHAPQWGATASIGGSSKWRWHFNPRTPVGCDAGATAKPKITPKVSIHAPQWGATCALLQFAQITLFQSTHPSGVRLNVQSGLDLGRAVSIHAPQWGATKITLHACCRNLSFNPRIPVGCDLSEHATEIAQASFNPRTPVGCDAPFSTICDTASVFQSTHPSGVRLREWA